MNLHENNDAFVAAISGAADYYGIEEALVEKDYYVSLFLDRLKDRVPHLLFKGGTSLSKCHKIIDRFSEDIDLTLDAEHSMSGPRKHMKDDILAVLDELGMKLLNEEEIRSRRDYNCYRVEYPINYPSRRIKPYLLIETVFIMKSFPDEVKPMNSMIAEWLGATRNTAAIEKYELLPFDIRVQTLERTLVDKVFAICDYMLDNRTERQSRHIYDISRLLTAVKLDDSLKELVKEVREERKSGVKSFSAQDSVNVPKLLQEIIDRQVYKKDYEDNTQELLTKRVPYDETIKAIEKIIESRIFLY